MMDHRRHHSVPQEKLAGFSFLSDGPTAAAHADSSSGGDGSGDEEGGWTEAGTGAASGGALAKAWRNHPALLVALPVCTGAELGCQQYRTRGVVYRWDHGEPSNFMWRCR